MNTVAQQPKHASPLQVIKAVLWSFLGIRRRAAHEADFGALKPLHVIIAGLLLAALFVLGLIMVVRLVLHAAA